MSLRSKVAVLVLLAATPLMASEREEAFWEAARQGDLAAIRRLHEGGVEVNASTKYGATALAYACDRGHLEVVRYLIESGADVNTQDSFYEFTPLGWSLFNEHVEITRALVEAGATGVDQVLSTGVRKKDKLLIELALGSEKIDSGHVAAALELARQAGAEEMIAMLEAAEVKPSQHKTIDVDPELLESYVGSYKNDEVSLVIDVTLQDGVLTAQATNQPALPLRALSESRFEARDMPQIKLSFGGRGGLIERIVVEQGSTTTIFPRATVPAEQLAAEIPPAPEAAPVAKPEPQPTAKIVRQAARNWPSFRGPDASGIADGQGAVAEWSVETGHNVRWKTAIPGMANSSPIVWRDRVFVTTAVSGAGDDTFRSGLYGDVDSVDDESEHSFRVYALDRDSGKIVWERIAAAAVPGAKRHLKSTQANSTPVTDGKNVVALFGTIGLLVAYDFDGKERWRADLGVLDAGWFYDESYQWGHASSPVIYGDVVIVQADIDHGSFLGAWRLVDGKPAWRTERSEAPSWGSPTIYRGEKRDELIANGTTIRGYDPKTGRELWSLGPNSEVTVATPIAAHGLFYVTAGYPPVRPIYAIRPGGSGDISLPEEAESSEAIAWSKSRGGTYMPTPIVYGDYLYTCANDGRLTCYHAKTGERVYRARVGSGAYTASPIAADGRLYFATEEGEVIVAKAGPEYEELARNEMGEIIMSTPAISDGLLVVRTLGHVYGIGAPQVSR